MGNVYHKLEQLAPKPEQVAVYKRKRGWRLSFHEQVELDEALAEKRHQRRITQNPTPKPRHPERKPGPVTITKQGS